MFPVNGATVERIFLKAIAFDPSEGSILFTGPDIDPARREELEEWLAAGDRVRLDGLRLIFADGTQSEETSGYLQGSFLGVPVTQRGENKEVRLDWQPIAAPTDNERENRFVEDYAAGIVRFTPSHRGLPTFRSDELPKTTEAARARVKAAFEAAEAFELTARSGLTRLFTEPPQRRISGPKGPPAAARHWETVKPLLLASSKSLPEIVQETGLTQKRVRAALEWALSNSSARATGERRGRRYWLT